MKETKIQVRKLYKIFGSDPSVALEMADKGVSRSDIQQQTDHVIAVRNVSFAVKEGEIFVLMGLSGSGKSTLVRCLNRLIDPTSGEIIINRKDITKCSKQELLSLRRGKVAMVFQNFGLFPHRTVWQNVAYGLKVQGMSKNERRERAYESLELVGLKGWEENYPDELSGGMKQRVGLARAVSTDADILLMDEAFSALDPLIRAEMQDELLKLQQKMKKTIIFITHDLSEALKLGDQIAVMRDGEIVQIATAEKLLSSPADSYVASFVKNIDRSQIVTVRSVMKQPQTIVSPKSGPRVALHKMEELGLSSIFVVDADNHLKGIVTVDQAIEAAKNGIDSLDSIVSWDFPTIHPDEKLAELIPIAAEAKTPIAVLDENKHLLGIIVRVSVLAGLVEAQEVGANEQEADKEEKQK